MRLTKAQRDENHERILRVAARLFREKGIDGVGIDEIMATAGLTHGAFYGHFPSKTALAGAAAVKAMTESATGLFDTPEEAESADFTEYAKRYLTQQHRDHPGRGCGVAGLAVDVARQGPEAQAAFAGELGTLLDRSAARLPGDRDAARQSAIVNLATLVGALVMARAAGKAKLSDEILTTARDWLTKDEAA
ncbi:MAG TPA: helix-turn-helix domain-containing protein [Stellaceae bacterium]|nr:helix-turn-helix domain-containing protein [Stellaceae bacterium]